VTAPIAELELPRVYVGDRPLRDRLRPTFGAFFLDAERETLEQWDGTAWVGRGSGGKTAAGKTAERRLGRLGVEGPADDADVGGGNEAAAGARSWGDSAGGFASGLGGGGGSAGGGGGTAVGPAHVAGDPPLAGPGSEMTAVPIVFGGGKLANVAGAIGTDFPVVGTTIKLDIWNGVEVPGVGCTLSTANNNVVIDVAGKWRVHARFYVTGGADTDWSWQCYVYVNGAVRARVWGFQTGIAAGGLGSHMEVDTILSLAVGDIVDIRGNTLASANLVSPGQLQRDDVFEVTFLGA
jgi:hypothetical protein